MDYKSNKNSGLPYLFRRWREKRAKERYYQCEIKRVMQEAELAGLLVGKRSVRDPRHLSNLFRVPCGL